MTIERMFGTLALIATVLILAAFWMIGIGPRSAGPVAVALPALPSFDGFWPTDAPAGSMRDLRLLAAAFVAGWLGRWVYGLPWSAMPRAVLHWLLGWRTSVIMLVVALGCMAVLLLY